MKEPRENVLSAARDAARNFAYYRRSESLGVDELAAIVRSGAVTVHEIAEAFEDELRGWGGLTDRPTDFPGGIAAQ